MPIHRPYRLHPLRQFDAENAHRPDQYIRQGPDQDQTEGKDTRIRFAENRCIVVILIEFLCQVKGIVGNDGRTEGAARLLYL